MGNGDSQKVRKLRSREWFDNPDNPDMTALYLERYLNYGLTREELQSGMPIIGIALVGIHIVVLTLLPLRGGCASRRRSDGNGRAQCGKARRLVPIIGERMHRLCGCDDRTIARAAAQVARQGIIDIAARRRRVLAVQREQ